MPGSPQRIDESEDCAELDADYFQSLGKSIKLRIFRKPKFDNKNYTN